MMITEENKKIDETDAPEVEYEAVEKELLDELKEEGEKNDKEKEFLTTGLPDSLKNASLDGLDIEEGNYDDARKIKDPSKDSKYRGVIKYQKRKYLVTEYHSPSDIIGKYGIGVEVPGVMHKARIFVVGINGVDCRRFPNDDLAIQRPVIFDTQEECIRFMSQMYFPDFALRDVYITDDLYHRDIFPTMGAYKFEESRLLS